MVFGFLPIGFKQLLQQDFYHQRIMVIITNGTGELDEVISTIIKVYEKKRQDSQLGVHIIPPWG